MNRHMNRHTVLRFLIRATGVVMLLALPAVFMPTDLMAATHRWLGLGELPGGPLVEYLARSTSLLYVLLGALFLVISGDLPRYAPIIRFFGAGFVVFGLVMVGVDLGAGMPLYWTLSEGPPAIALGLAMLWLGRNGPAGVEEER